MTKTLLKSSTALVMSIALALPTTGFSQSRDDGPNAQKPSQEASECAPGAKDCKAPAKQDDKQAERKKPGQDAAPKKEANDHKSDRKSPDDSRQAGQDMRKRDDNGKGADRQAEHAAPNARMQEDGTGHDRAGNTPSAGKSQSRQAEAPQGGDKRPPEMKRQAQAPDADHAPKMDGQAQAKDSPDGDTQKRKMQQDQQASKPRSEDQKRSDPKQAEAPGPKADDNRQAKGSPDGDTLKRRMEQDQQAAKPRADDQRQAEAPKPMAAPKADDSRRAGDNPDGDTLKRRMEQDQQARAPDNGPRTNDDRAGEDTERRAETEARGDRQQRAMREAQREDQRRSQRREIAAAGDGKAANVEDDKITERDVRKSDQAFRNRVDQEAPKDERRAGDGRNDGSLMDTLAKAALAGVGAYAVGSLLNNGDKVVSNSGDRVVVERDGNYHVLKNDDVLLRQPGNDVRTSTYSDGSTRTTVVRPNGTKIETIRAADGTVLQRTRILDNGQRVVLFDDTRSFRSVDVAKLPKPSTQVIEYSGQDSRALERALAQHRTGVDRTFSLSQVRDISAVRKLVPEVSVDEINFATGSAVIRPEQAQSLAALGKTMHDMIVAHPDEVFLIEGHTDAVGNAGSNLALSDRRAESLAAALTEYFDVPPENMVVQGYGESDLKVQTSGSDRDNRRAAVRDITPLLDDNS